MYEWLPWVDSNLDRVPKDPKARKKWLMQTRGGWISANGRGYNSCLCAALAIDSETRSLTA